jgi:hypothetical protein
VNQLALMSHGFLQARENVVRQILNLRGALDLGLQDRKFVAAEPRDQILRKDDAF